MFFEILIAPFLYFIKWVYALWFGVTGSHGASIVLLSFTVSLVLLPIFIYIEKTKKRNDAVKARMKPLVDEIKRCYRGQERYYYLKTLNRQHGFNPFKAMIPILSLLLQIPFFIAAYQFLADYEPLASTQFLFIKDLSQPDGLLGSVHLLPILMTVVNVATAYLYTLHGDKAERNQMYVVAGLFLILLFNLPSGLVLYWTLNNVFSFFRLFITHPEVFKRVEGVERKSFISLEALKLRFKVVLPSLLHTLWVVFAIGMLSQLNWALGHGFNGFGHRIQLTAVGSLGIVLLFLLFNMLYSAPSWMREEGVKGTLKVQWPIFRTTFFLLAAVLILTQVNWALKYDFGSIVIRIVGAVFIAAIATLLIAIVVSVYQKQLQLPKATGKYNILKMEWGYQLLAAVILVVGIYLQVNWAVKYSFGSIIPRVAMVCLVSWLLPVLIKWFEVEVQQKFNIALKHYVKENLISTKAYSVFVGSVLLIFLWFSYKTLGEPIGMLRVYLFKSFVISGAITLLFVFGGLFAKLAIDYVKRITVRPVLFYGAFFFSAYFYFTQKYLYQNTHASLMLLIAFASILIVQFTGIVYLVKGIIERQTAARWLVVFVSLCFITLQLAILWVRVTGIPIEFTSIGVVLEGQFGSIERFVKYGLLVSLLLLPAYCGYEKPLVINLKYSHWFLFVLGILFIVGNIFLWHPLVAYSSFPEVFLFSGSKILISGFTSFLISFTAFLLLYILTVPRYRWVFLTVILTFTALFVVHSTILPLDMGTMQGDVFENPEALDLSLYWYIVEAVTIALLFVLFTKVLKRGKLREVLVVLVLLNLLTAGQGLYKGIASGSFFATKQEANTESSILLKHKVFFSKTEKNILYIIPDMLQGWYLNKMLDENFKLAEELDGFVWFPNTLSISSITNTSIGPLLGGFEYVPDNLDKDTERTIGQKLSNIKEELAKKVQGRNMRFSSTRLPYISIPDSLYHIYYPDWMPAWDKKLDRVGIQTIEDKNVELLCSSSLFFGTPIALKPLVYNNGKWFTEFFRKKEQNEIADYKYQFLRLLPYISEADKGKGSFFVYYTTVSHYPWYNVDEKGGVIRDVSPYENGYWTIQQLTNWFNWMKKNGVYDNTRIIIVSDHGTVWNRYKGEIDIDIPFKNFKGWQTVPEPYPHLLNAMLLVKDFDERGSLEKDWRFMSNADAIGLALSDTLSLALPLDSNRVLPAYIAWWDDGLGKQQQFNIGHKYMVKDGIFDAHDWKMVWDKRLGIINEK